MLGIPSGDREARPRRDDRPKGGDRPRTDDASASGQGEAPRVKGNMGQSSGGPGAGRGGKGRGKGAAKGSGNSAENKPEAKARGPLVVIRRASGQVETRGPLEGEPAAETATASGVDSGATASGASGAAAQAGAAGEVSSEVGSAPDAQTAAGGGSDDASSGTRREEPRRERPRAQVPSKPTGALYEEAPEDQSFAEMFAEAESAGPIRRSFKVGDKVQGSIFQLGADTAFISLGGKSEAMIDLSELQDKEGVLRHGVGDVIEAFVIENGAGGIHLSRALGKGIASQQMLEDAKDSGLPVEGLILAVNKGGLEVAVGDVRAFCPASQVDVRFRQDFESMVGERHLFRVTEASSRKIVVSRRALLEEEQAAKAVKTRELLRVGAVLPGEIVNVRDFGAFVDLGGIEGLIPVSELSYVRVKHPSEIVNPGDKVEVEVIRMEAADPGSPDKARQKERITLSMRARQADPVREAIQEMQLGQRLTGKVVRLQPFGAFVELRPGVDGLVHISALAEKRIAHPRDAVKEGEEIEVEIDKLEPESKRIGLRRVVEGKVLGDSAGGGLEGAPGGEPGAVPRVGQVVVGKIDRIEPYGVFVAFPGGKGLVPASETGTQRGTDMKRHFQLDQELKVQILDIDGATGKIRLSVKGAVAAEERAEIEAWQRTQQPASGKGLGTMADLLKGLKI